MYTGFIAMVHVAKATPLKGQSPGYRGVLTGAMDPVSVWVNCISRAGMGWKRGNEARDCKA